MTGQELKRLRNLLQLTQVEMAKRLGVSFMSENTWEHKLELSRFANLVVEKFMSERGLKLEDIPMKGGEKEKGQRSRSTPGPGRKTPRGKRRKKNGHKSTSERNESAVQYGGSPSKGDKQIRGKINPKGNEN